jgi:hypothetical protein
VRNNAAPRLVPKKGAIQVPCEEYGFTGHTNTRRRNRGLVFPALTHSAAAAIATAPPREVPSKSNDASPRFLTNLTTRRAVDRIEWSIPLGRSENPAPNKSGAYKVAYGATAGITKRQENEYAINPCRRISGGPDPARK